MPVNGVYNKRIKCPGPTGEFQISLAVPIAVHIYMYRVATEIPLKQEECSVSDYSHSDLSYKARPTAITLDLKSLHRRLSTQ
jgi:hypothetical protein